jgi:hypothetical protein
MMTAFKSLGQLLWGISIGLLRGDSRVDSSTFIFSHPIYIRHHRSLLAQWVEILIEFDGVLGNKRLNI